jgi:hypothetical protein
VIDPKPLATTSVWVRIGALGVDGNAPLSIQSSTTTVYARFVCPPDRIEANSGHRAAGRQRCSDAEVGCRLSAATFCTPLSLALLAKAQADPDHLLRLWVICADPALAALPWELLTDPVTGQRLTRKGSISRWLSSDGDILSPTRSVTASGPVRALLIGSSPEAAREIEAIVQVFDDAPASIAAKPTVLQNPDRQSIIDTFGQAHDQTRPFDVVHFAGPASFRQEGTPALVLHGDDPHLSAHDLGLLARTENPRLVVLNVYAFPGAAANHAAVLPAFASELATNGVPGIIGMRKDVHDGRTASVVADLYAALLDGRTVDRAVIDVRNLIEREDDELNHPADIPVWYLAPDCGPLVQRGPQIGASGDDSTPEPRPWSLAWMRANRRRLARYAVTTIIPLLVFYMTLVTDVQGWWASRQLPVMDGSFNVAVAEFSVENGVDEELGGLDKVVFDHFATRLGCDDGGAGPEDVDIRFGCIGPDRVGRRIQPTPVDSLEAFESLANSSNADVVVAGVLQVTEAAVGGEPRAQLKVVLYVSPDNLDLAPEVTGVHELAILGAASPAGGRAAAKVQREELAARVVEGTAALAELIFVLGYQELGRYEDALARLRRVDDQSVLVGSNLTGVIAGNLHGQLGQLHDAEQAYAAAQTGHPRDPRPVLGLAEIAYQKAAAVRGAAFCQQGALNSEEEKLLDDAAQTWTDAMLLGGSERPRVEGIGLLGFSRVATCRTLAGQSDQRAAATKHAAAVLDLQEQHGALADIAAFANMNLYLLARSLAEASRGTAAVAAWREARDHANAAFQLRSQMPDAASLYLTQGAIALYELGDDDQACLYLVEARALASPGSTGNGIEDPSRRADRLADIDRLTANFGCAREQQHLIDEHWTNSLARQETLAGFSSTFRNVPNGTASHAFS